MKSTTKKIVKQLIEDNEFTIEMIKLSPALAIEMLEKKINILRKEILK